MKRKWTSGLIEVKHPEFCSVKSILKGYEHLDCETVMRDELRSAERNRGEVLREHKLGRSWRGEEEREREDSKEGMIDGTALISLLVLVQETGLQLKEKKK